MMRGRLIAALTGFGLTAAAPPQATLQQLAECRLSSDQAVPLLASLPVLRTKEVEDGAMRRISRVYAVPAGLSVFGFTPDSFDTFETREAGDDRIMTTITVKRPYAEVLDAVLAGHGLSECDAVPERGICGVFASRPGGKRVTMMVFDQGDGRIDISCSYGLVRK